jgi:carbonic anhydrase
MSKSSEVQSVEKANAEYAAHFGEKGKLPLPPARRFAVLTCMDARVDPAKLAGFSEGDAHVIRNAGGRASDDAIRSLVISYKLLGTKEFFVIHHTDCGMVLFDREIMSGLLAKSLEQAVIDENGWRDVGQGPGSPEGAKIDWLTFTDDRQAVIDDVKKVRNHPLVPKSIPVYGYLYDVRTGKLEEITEATQIGKAA